MQWHDRLSRRGMLGALALGAGARWARGAAQQQNTTFSADVKVVNLYATVRDKKGQIVTGLEKDDFVLDEEGRPQPIRYFARESNLPLTVGLLVDTSGSTRRVLPDERTASRRFLQQVLREGRDFAFVIHFDFEVELLQDLTSSHTQLSKALDELETGEGRPQWGQRGSGGPGGGQGPYPGAGRRAGGRRGGGTSLYDSIYLASDELMRKQSGRKALILLTDGMDMGSKVTLESCVESAQRADTLVYSILFEDPEMAYGGLGGPGMGRRGGWGRGGGGPRVNTPDGKKVLQQISRETGGRFFEVSRKRPIEKVFAEIEEDLRNQYSLGYTPDTAAAAGYRRIHLTTRQKGLVVQTREGYYGS
jgi:VWFA-related protein